MEIMVYFNSGDKARFSADKVVFTDNCGDPVKSIQLGLTEINWSNVCFIREYEPKKEYDE